MGEVLYYTKPKDLSTIGDILLLGIQVPKVAVQIHRAVTDIISAMSNTLNTFIIMPIVEYLFSIIGNIYVRDSACSALTEVIRNNIECLLEDKGITSYLFEKYESIILNLHIPRTRKGSDCELVIVETYSLYITLMT